MDIKLDFGSFAVVEGKFYLIKISYTLANLLQCTQVNFIF